MYIYIYIYIYIYKQEITILLIQEIIIILLIQSVYSNPIIPREQISYFILLHPPRQYNNTIVSIFNILKVKIQLKQGK
jgi:hypothetical protein